ncbi:hypothetical protein CMI37_33655 [Candidatus Pacearchaeota archaeon]|nr:hypothetical protein [Candidatus Pacearchaeota archaeon]|tara:strand:+ start:615 stop:1688 length:1074 start_codon:yes stop_codon:yes gene_type:complete
MDLAFEVPINPVSFGQVSTSLLREVYARGINPSIFPIGNVDISTQIKDDDFFKWLEENLKTTLSSHKRERPVIKLWHLNGGFNSVSNKQILITFYELDSPTKAEINISKQNVTVVTSSYTKQIFEANGVDTHFVPLGFDKYNFKEINKEYFSDDRIVFNLCGKLEKRKNHKKVIQAWAKRFGDDSKYYLQCAVFNTFLKDEDNKRLFNDCTAGKKFFNITFLNYLPHNTLYNDFLNSGDIVIGMSGGEGWSLPEFHSLALGKHGVLMNAHANKDWANEKNSILVNPSGKVEAYDGVFFSKGADFNQGNIFDFDEDEFIHGCEEAIKRTEENKKNLEGLLLQEEFTYSKTLDKLLELI